jgi:2-iminobutanoate/2-iminopropanoate deaminase
MTEKGPRSVGPYSTATIYNGFVFVSGMGPIDPNTNKVIASSVEEQARTMFTNVKTVLEELGSSMNDVLKVTLYLKDNRRSRRGLQHGSQQPQCGGFAGSVFS